jgi:FkbM family methyltransferase
MMISPRKLAKKALGIQSWNSDDDQKLVIPDAKIIFDVGANIGQSAKSYRRLFPEAEIWSFEPFPASFDSLCRSISDQRFHPEPLALSDRIAGASLNIGAVSFTNSLLRRETDTGKTIEIKTDTLDHFCTERGITNIDILKVDVEGAEDRVFRGARGLFSLRAIRSVFVEVYFNAVYEGMPLFWDLQAQLSDLGFSLFGLYSMIPTRNGALSFANALYVLQPGSHPVSRMGHSHTRAASFAGQVAEATQSQPL